MKTKTTNTLKALWNSINPIHWLAIRLINKINQIEYNKPIFNKPNERPVEYRFIFEQMAEYYPKTILDVRGSEFHKKMMDVVNPEKCPRCTFGPYNEMVEQVFIKDEMCRFFP